MKVRLSPDARAFAKAEAAYLREHSAIAAKRFANDLRTLQQHLGQFPQMGQASPDIPLPGIFRFVMGNYRINYQMESGVIEILTIRHGRQSPAAVPIEDDADFEDIGPEN